MGVLWIIYCLKHREELDTGKFRELGEKQDLFNTSPAQALAALRKELLEEPGTMDRGERLLFERALTLASAFVDRHQGCALRLTNDWDPDPTYREALESTASDGTIPNWREFSIWLDVPYWRVADELARERYPGRFPYDWETAIAGTRARVVELSKGEDGSTKSRGRRAKRELKGTMKDLEMLERQYRFVLEFRKKEHDVLEEIQTSPLA